MKFDLIREFTKFDQKTFARICHSIGLSSSACYRIVGDDAILSIATNDPMDSHWPPSVRVGRAVQKLESSGWPIGWNRGGAFGACEGWPKGVYFYLPDQDLSSVKVLLVATKPSGVRLRSGTVHVLAEALCQRVSRLLERSDRLDDADRNMSEHYRQLQADIKMLIDHEIRTPVAAISGFVSFIQESASIDESLAGEVESALNRLNDALARIDVFFENSKLVDGDNLRVTEMREWTCALVKEFSQSLQQELPRRHAEVSINYVAPEASSSFVRVDPKTMGIAIREVLANACSYLSVTKVDVMLYGSDQSLIIDISDDGGGVGQGMEHLIFTRFFQDPSSKSARRYYAGKGIGLFLAKKIVESHNGSLSFVRGGGRNGLFRVILPLTSDGTKLHRQGA